MKCNLCKKELREKEGSYYWIEGKLTSYCKICSPKVENMSNLPEVMIIPITPKSFEKVIEKKVYSHPINYGRKGGKYITFYISSPKSAITHIAKVKLILKETHQKMYFLQDIKKLESPILRGDSSGIQGTQNTTLERLKNSKYLKELS
tara:strand:+ start:88 stop:531 length:444 start_codon:yes stop_codon:yes gene_type:complete